MKRIRRISYPFVWGATLFWLFLLIQAPAIATPTVKAPDVVGQTEAMARTALEKAGFKVPQPSLIVPTEDKTLHGKVKEQILIKERMVVLLKIYDYVVDQVMVPNIEGVSKEEAREIIKKAGLKNTATYDFF